MEWVQMIAIIGAVLGGVKWLLFEMRIYQTGADKDRREILELVRSIQQGSENLHKKTEELHKETEQMHKNLCPVEKRHFR